MNTTNEKLNGRYLLQASIGIVLLFDFCALIVRSFVRLQLTAYGYPDLLAKDLSWLLVPIILGILMFPILRQNWTSLIFQLNPRLLSLRLVFFSLALGASLRIAFWGAKVSNAGFQLFDFQDAIEGPLFSFYCPTPVSLGLTIFVTAILTPIVEEVLNRGFFLNALLRHGRVVAVIGSSVIFGVFHSTQTIWPAIIFGLFVAVQYIRLGNLWVPIIAHATYNSLVVVDSLCFQHIWNPDAMTSSTIAVGSMALALMIVSLILAGLLTSRRWYVR